MLSDGDIFGEMIAQLIQHPATEWNLENISLSVAILGLLLIFRMLRGA